MAKEFPLISIITLNYNQTALTCSFLESARSLTYPNYEILVCDMNSDSDPEPEITRGSYSPVRLIRSPANLGFSGGNNLGMRAARGSFFFLVNNDTQLTTDLLEKLLSPMEADPAVGITSPRILYLRQPDTLEYAGFGKMDFYTGRSFTRGRGEKDSGQYAIPGPLEAAHGCAMLVRKEAVEKAGMLPESFFMYYEEWDWSARIRKAGYTIWFTPAALIYHLGSASIGPSNPLKIYYQTRNRILFIRRNASAKQKFVFALYFALIALPKNLAALLLKGKTREAGYFIKGALWNLVHSSRSVI